MFIKKVFTSEREYYERGEDKAYITLNSASGLFRVYMIIAGRTNMVAEYKRIANARKYLTQKGFF